MYLATLARGPHLHYELRHSYATGEHRFAHRTLFDLGPRPERFITPCGDNAVLFDEVLLAAAEEACGEDAEASLERLLLPFFPAEIRRRLALFPPRARPSGGPLTDSEREAIRQQVQLFDRRRLYYLRCGAVDQSRLSRLREVSCRPLLGQSRDEREYLFAREERVLETGMYFQYVYAIFTVGRHFPQDHARWFPEALPRDEVADRFIEELCRHNADTTLFADHDTTSLHPHLRRYAVMFFDHIPTLRSFQAEFAEAFMAGHRRFRWPKKPQASREQVSNIFATPYEELQRMSPERLARLFRHLALRLHPDQGGDHEAFIRLSEAYKQLRRAARKGK
jgi:hypothetical protein